MDLFPGYCYCIDTSALIDLKPYFHDVFPSLWKSLEDFISKDRLIAPREVLKELQRGDDELLRWARAHKRMFKDLDYEQIEQLRIVLRDCREILELSKTTADADPIVIALAISKGAKVITSEKFADPPRRPRIPNVCQHFNVKCISLYDFFKEQGWKF